MKSHDMESKEAKERKQKESHSEIERKRRERMKKETEYLNLQLPEADRKDKLSVFQAGCDQLIQYTDSLEKRDFILNDAEYTSIICSNFSGFDIHIRCSDGKIVHAHENVRQILGQQKVTMESSTVFDICEPSAHTTDLIREHLSLTPNEYQLCKQGELVRRDLTIPMRNLDPNLESKCVPSSDYCWYRFIELCGEISNGNEDTSMKDGEEISPILKALCRPRDPGASFGGFRGSVHSHITTKHRPDSLRITEVTGQVLALLGIDCKTLIGKELSDLVPSEERSFVRKSFYDALKTGSIVFICPLEHQSGRKIRFRIELTVIDINGKVQFIIAKSSLAGTDMDDESRECVTSGVEDSSSSGGNRIGFVRQKELGQGSSHSNDFMLPSTCSLQENKSFKISPHVGAPTNNNTAVKKLQSTGTVPGNNGWISRPNPGKQAILMPAYTTSQAPPSGTSQSTSFLLPEEGLLTSSSQAQWDSASISNNITDSVGCYDFGLPQTSSFQELLDENDFADISLDLFEPNHLQELMTEDLNDLTP